MLEDGEAARRSDRAQPLPRSWDAHRRSTASSPGAGGPIYATEAAIAETAPSGNAARRDAVFRRLLALADVLAAAVAIVVGGALLEADLVNLGLARRRCR